MASANKLHPVYVALDNHQYNRAIKLCLSQPNPNCLCQALLAHAYSKSGQKYKALLVLQRILPKTGYHEESMPTVYFPEFQSELKYLHTLEGSSDNASIVTNTPLTSNALQSNSQPANKKYPAKGKGKKKNTTTSTVQTNNSNQQVISTTLSPPVNPDGWDLVDQLDTPPILPEDWERLPPPDISVGSVPPEASLLDPAVIATISMTLSNILKLPLTAYQLYCWAASHKNLKDDEELYIRKAYTTGIIVLLSLQYESIRLNILANLQVLALQLARLNGGNPTSPTNLWAAQTALWQIQYTPSTSDTMDPKIQQRISMLPRLAETLASKTYKAIETFCSLDANREQNNTLVYTESFLLYTRALDIQGDSKHQEKLDAIESKLKQHESNINDTTSNQQHSIMYPPRETMLRMKVDTLRKLGRYNDAKMVLEQQLLDDHPDDWKYWKLHLDCSIQASDGDVKAACAQTVEFASQVVTKLRDQIKYPLRGPRWITLEAALQLVKENKGNDSIAFSYFFDCIKSYWNEFAASCSSTFSDLCPFLDYCNQHCSTEQVAQILEWNKHGIPEKPNSDDVKIRRSELRAYICSLQLNFKLLSRFDNLRDQFLPSFEEILSVWRSFKSFEDSNASDQEQKESRPADEVILLAVQRLLCDDNFTNRVIAVHLLEDAILYSPHNAYLKIAAILIYSELNATSRCWQLYSELYIKHIQHESCSHIILKALRSGGFYIETINVCQDILGLQRISTREAGEFTGRAAENGSICKADEFISFHWKHMFKSLVTLEAKGLVLDCAPMFIQDENQTAVGALHGIVGGDYDLDRVKQMISEAHNPSGAFSLLRLKGSVSQNIKHFSDNRDFGITSFQILSKASFDTPEQILSESIRRGYHHNILIRAALCVDATRPPKKGKVSKASLELENRCKSLIKSALAAEGDVGGSQQPNGYVSLLACMKSICKALVAVGAGLDSAAEIVYNTLEERENAGVETIQEAKNFLLRGHEELAITAEPSVSRTSRLLPDCVVPLYALFQMLSKIADAFGWGKRKRKTKRFSAAIAELSLTFVSLLDDMLLCLSQISEGTIDWNFVPTDILDQSLLAETYTQVVKSQLLTKDRIETVLMEIRFYFASFDVDESQYIM